MERLDTSLAGNKKAGKLLLWYLWDILVIVVIWNYTSIDVFILLLAIVTAIKIRGEKKW